MALIDIQGGPSKPDFVSRVLSGVPVTFQTDAASLAVLVEEIQETDATGEGLSILGRVAVGQHRGARVLGTYDCSTRTGRLSVRGSTVDGV